ncbi:hypothetical protein B0A49_05086 [Cryomyces minteri]|uniref:WW domain-containing protein n=1 Tax=Cryomyces minteri TaxID=331657 RepID=A0A4U0WVC5_9PEZI|nr:hypothetical protein B0A49_05086 [Cryomyces minteri]
MEQPPPSYEAAAGSSSSSAASQHLSRNGIPASSRRSMEDEHRPLPTGWVRQYDSKTHHQYFVDTTANPPRSIWQHPYDDKQFLDTLDPVEREHVTRLHRSVSLKDIEAESSDDEAGGHMRGATKGQFSTQGRPAMTTSDANPHGVEKFGRKIKDRLTHSTHQEREMQRRQRAEEEQKAYEAHLAFRRAMSEAMRTGQPQFIGRDRNGKDVYIESPNGPPVPQGAYGYNPYAQGPYTNPNARFIRPEQPYARPYGYGYGGGYGFPLMGGVLGGAMLGGLLF